MFLFILESIGTSELILIGIVALIFLGPRRLPQIARKIGKMTAEFRGTANEFKETWRREVDLEEESKALDLNAIEAETTVPRSSGQVGIDMPDDLPAVPLIKEADPEMVERLREQAANVSEFDDGSSDIEDASTADEISATAPIEANDKRNWL